MSSYLTVTGVSIVYWRDCQDSFEGVMNTLSFGFTLICAVPDPDYNATVCQVIL